ncbi:MAG TPA: ATP-binding cassette domain-containing protein [Thermoanaerobaculia bacterium]|nr:ATP-binding cassette domain-containing protein [Thermoanaerobaculia bacterium]
MSPVEQPAPAGPEPRIQLRRVVKSFGRKRVLDGLDLSVAAGASMVVIGGSGTGKSVTLRHVIGLLKPDSGSVVVDGVAIEQLDNRGLTEFRRRFGMAFQEGALFDSMNVYDNVAFPLRRLSRKSAGEIRERVEECLEMVRLAGQGARDISELSGGMRRRVGFARAIAHEPEILLFDEPTTGLDPVNTALIGEVIRHIGERLKTTAVTITHDMQLAFRIADRIAMLDHGKIIAEAPPEEFKELSDPRVQQFIHGDAEGPLSEDLSKDGEDGEDGDDGGSGEAARRRAAASAH